MSLWVHLICPMSIFFLHGFYFFLWSSSSSIRGFSSSSGFVFPWFFFLRILQTVGSSVFFKFFRLWVLFSSNSSDLLLLLFQILLWNSSLRDSNFTWQKSPYQQSKLEPVRLKFLHWTRASQTQDVNLLDSFKTLLSNDIISIYNARGRISPWNSLSIKYKIESIQIDWTLIIHDIWAKIITSFHHLA